MVRVGPVRAGLRQIHDEVLFERKDHILEAAAQGMLVALAKRVSHQRQADQTVSYVIQIPMELRPVFARK